jgi:hypothetical protein
VPTIYDILRSKKLYVSGPIRILVKRGHNYGTR